MFINLLLKFSISFHYECTCQSSVLFHTISRVFVHNTGSAFGGGGALAYMTFLILEALNFMKLHACFPVTSQSLQTSGYSFLLVLLQLRDAELDLLFEGLLASCG